MRNNWQSIGHDCHRWLQLKEEYRQGKWVIPNNLNDLKFERCPYCGDPLSDDYKSKVKIELDTLHYGEKRLLQFVERLRKDYRYEILDQFRSNSGIWIVLLEVEDDGDKIAIQLQNYPEVKMAYDKRHERIVLN